MFGIGLLFMDWFLLGCRSDGLDSCACVCVLCRVVWVCWLLGGLALSFISFVNSVGMRASCVCYVFWYLVFLGFVVLFGSCFGCGWVFV